MKLGKLSLANFGSYKELDLDLSGLGLSLFYGKTGSGKSTIPDAIYWCLFGDTAKGVNSDDIKAWDAEADTVGGIEVDDITICRVRGVKNDLHWSDENGNSRRGKDLNDTQRLINELLGCTPEEYVAAAYFHEFSPVAAFFTAKAKDRQDLLEGLADLSFPVTLLDRAQTRRKDLKKTLTPVENKSIELGASVAQLKSYIHGTEKQLEKWVVDQQITIHKLKTELESYETSRLSKMAAIQTKLDVWDNAHYERVDALVAKIEALESGLVPFTNKGLNCDKLTNKSLICEKCGSIPKKAQEAQIAYTQASMSIDAKKDTLASLIKETNPYKVQIKSVKEESENPYHYLIAQENKRINPHGEMLNTLNNKLAQEAKIEHDTKNQVGQLRNELSSVEHLMELSSNLRTELLTRTIASIQDETNRVLDAYFESELRVGFTLESGSILNVEIHKDGHSCSYKQLSKGQRGLLKLAFTVSVMKAASNKIGLSFDLLCFDEALDGLDADLKVKAFSLFQELEKQHGSIILIDHSTDFQNLFTNRFHVTMENGHSEIEHEG